MQPRLVDALPAKLEEAPLVSLEQIIRVAGHLEEELDAKQVSCAASHHAAEESQVGVVDSRRRQVVRITEWHEVDRRRAFGVRPGEETVREGAQLPLALGLG